MSSFEAVLVFDLLSIMMVFISPDWCRHVHNRMVVGFTTTYDNKSKTSTASNDDILMVCKPNN
jgi:hypothetical protein